MQLGGLEFEELVQLAKWTPPQAPGIYVIGYPNLFTDDFTPIYVGEAKDFSSRGFSKGTRPEFDCWLKEAGSEEFLFVSIMRMPKSSEAQRKETEKHLIERLGPPCNTQHNPEKTS